MLNFTIIFSKVASIFSLTTNDYKNSIKLYKMQTNGDCDIMVDCASESIHFGQSSLLTAVYHLRITDYTYRRNFIHFYGNFPSFFLKNFNICCLIFTVYFFQFLAFPILIQILFRTLQALIIFAFAIQEIRVISVRLLYQVTTVLLLSKQYNPT